jgi:natural product biosynthesis luciferase-like monooxygenase protein
MKFGLHYLMSCADTQSPAQRYRDSLEQAAHGEALGFESVWPVEQHFNRNISILPCPALLLAAMAERTRTMRLGTAIVQLPLANPLRVAEEIATLDVLSGGRVEFGVGRGSNPFHFAGFGVPMSESRDRFIEALDFIRQAWTQETFSFRGRFFQGEDILIVPKPLQRPHPLIRIAANSPETLEFAGRSAYPIFLASNVNPLPKLRELLPVYRNARKEAGHAEIGGDDVTLLMPLYVGENRDQIKRDLEPSIKQFVHFLSAATAPGLQKCASEAERQKLRVLLENMTSLTYEKVNEITGIFDTPEACVERLKQVQQEFSLGRVICWFNFGGMVPHDRVMRSMELFSSKVLPHF